MGAWPCGTIVMLGELYGSESMSQVYGQIHSLLQENSQHLDSLGGLLNYYACMIIKKFHRLFVL